MALPAEPMLLSLAIRADSVFSLRLVQLPMPTGSSDPDVLLDWLLESMALVRRRQNGSTGEPQSSALHRMMRAALLIDPLKGWDSKELGDETGLSNTGVHHQITKLRECGLVSAQVDGKWHRHVLRGGSITAATRLSGSQARSVLGVRLAELSTIVKPSESRMEVDSEEGDSDFSIRIAENRPRTEGNTATDELARDLGLAGDSPREGDDLASRVLSDLGSRDHPVTLIALSEGLSESRGRVNTVVDRMRSSGLAERVPMIGRIPQDVFSGLMRQYDARGGEWLMTKGGLGRLDETVSKPLADGAAKGSLDIDAVAEILEPVALQDQRVLLNTLGGRMPLGVRLSGPDFASVSQRVARLADRTIRRIETVAERLDSSLV